MSHGSTEGADRTTGQENGLTLLGSADAGTCADGVCVLPERRRSGTG